MNDKRMKEVTMTLENILSADQQAIKDFKAGKISSGNLNDINRENLEVVKKIIKDNGFPTITNTSKDAYKAAIMVVLHSGDLELYNRTMGELEEIRDGSIERKDIAYMIDKSRVIQDLPQLFGTQYRINNGSINFIEIENPDDLEKRREEYDMESFSEYKEFVEKNLKI